MKRLIFALFLIFMGCSLQAQQYTYSIGLAGGLVQGYGQAQNTFQGGFGASLDCYLTDFITAGVEGQIGKIMTGNLESLSSFHSVNQFKALNVNAKVNLKVFELIREGFLKSFQGLYLGAGVGRLKNDIRDISRINVYNPQTNKYELTPVNETGVYWTFPLLLGVDFQVSRRELSTLLIGLNTQLNIVPKSHLDGYIYRSGPGMYSFTSVSIKYRFNRRNFLNRDIFP